jgi:pyrroloquinoline quinone (PQQ) biosynthesis protein C
MIHKNISPKQALDKIDIDQRIKDFVKFSFEVITTKKSHLIASAFTYGREDVIPEIFIKIVEELDPKNAFYSKLKFYLNRHIEVDGETHGPIALEMMNELCGDDLEKWTEALRVGERALEYRIELWNAINDNILAQKKYLKTLPVHRYATSV